MELHSDQPLAKIAFHVAFCPLRAESVLLRNLTAFRGRTVLACSLGVPGYRGCRWNERKSERPDVTTGSPELALGLAEFASHFEIYHICRREKRAMACQRSVPGPPPLTGCRHPTRCAHRRVPAVVPPSRAGQGLQVECDSQGASRGHRGRAPVVNRGTTITLGNTHNHRLTNNCAGLVLPPARPPQAASPASPRASAHLMRNVHAFPFGKPVESPEGLTIGFEASNYTLP
eukprot:gene24981-biopygen8976